MRNSINWATCATFVMLLWGCDASPREPPAPPKLGVQEGHVYHFGYGSNLSESFLKRYCPNLKFVMKAERAISAWKERASTTSIETISIDWCHSAVL